MWLPVFQSTGQLQTVHYHHSRQPEAISLARACTAFNTCWHLHTTAHTTVPNRSAPAQGPHPCSAPAHSCPHFTAPVAPICPHHTTPLSGPRHGCAPTQCSPRCCLANHTLLTAVRRTRTQPPNTALHQHHISSHHHSADHSAWHKRRGKSVACPAGHVRSCWSE